MPPQQPYGPPPSQTGPEQYDFIVNYGKQKQPNRLVAINNSSFKSRLLLTGGGGLLLLILAWIVIALISGSSQNSSAPLVGIAQQQNELARISLEADQNASAQPTQIFAITTNLSLESEQRAVLAYLHSFGSTPSSSVLQASLNAKTDSVLKAAQITGTYDQTYISIAQSELTSYENALQQAFVSTKNLQEKQLLSTAFTQARLLMQQSSQTE